MSQETGGITSEVEEAGTGMNTDRMNSSLMTAQGETPEEVMAGEATVQRG